MKKSQKENIYTQNSYFRDDRSFGNQSTRKETPQSCIKGKFRQVQFNEANNDENMMR